MGRVKLKIKRLENTNSRHTTYAKRKHGIFKKACELSILCDIGIVLLMFSPTGKPSLCCGKQSVEEVIEKFAKLPPKERIKRMLDSLEVLKKTFQKLEHDVNIPELLGTRNLTTEDLINRVKLLRSRLLELQARLSYWKKPEEVDSIEDLGQMENSLRRSLDKIRTHKLNLLQQGQLISSECKHEIQNGMQMSFGVGAEQQLIHNFSLFSNGETRSLSLPVDPISIPHRDMEYSPSLSLPLGSYPGFFNTVKSLGIYNPVKQPVHYEPEETEESRYNVVSLAEKIRELEEWFGSSSDYHVGCISEASGTRFGLDRSCLTQFEERLFSQLGN